MHVACVSYFYDRDLPSPDALLSRYSTLTGWAEGLAEAGVQVTVVQRYATDGEIWRASIRYMFLRDPAMRFGGLFDRARRVNRAVAAIGADVVHVNGLGFARQARRLKPLLSGAPVLIQDHADRPPEGGVRRATVREALMALDGVSFAAREQAGPWLATGVIGPEMPVYELMEGSSRFRALSTADARKISGQSGDPLCLWVGRLDENKDPITVLNGFSIALGEMPGARLAMVFDESELLGAVHSWLDARPTAAERVELLGGLPHAELEALYNSADMFVLGSAHEGSGYAVIEAMACGATPVVTDIPSFRRLTGGGEAGALWPRGDAAALARALVSCHQNRGADSRLCTRRFFDSHWSFGAIGREAAGVYQQMLDRRAAASRSA